LRQQPPVGDGTIELTTSAALAPPIRLV